MRNIVKLKKKEKDWFKAKKYPHIGLQLDVSDKTKIQSYIEKKGNIEKHSFYPFIHRKLEVKRFRREICHDGTRSKLRQPSVKFREIYFSNHLDSNIYSYYAKRLSEAYEKKLVEKGISDCVTAYRSVRLKPEDPESRSKCNIDFASDVFTYIKTSGTKDLVAISFDIKSFFDSLDHKKLKKNWKELIGSGVDLPDDHYNVFRSITKFSYVEENEIFEKFKEGILVERNGNIVSRKVRKLKYLRNQRANAFCMPKAIEVIRESNLIKNHKYFYDPIKNVRLGLRTVGIPQGSPISAVLANVYMIDFDIEANYLLGSLGGIYRRYSDDMVIVCPVEHEKNIIEVFTDKVSQYHLSIQSSKTQVFHFKFDQATNRFNCFEKNLKTKKLQSSTNFEYLGFQFDGFFSLLKSSSLAGYYRKMKKGIARGAFYTYHNKTNTKGQLFKSRLYKKYTYLGAQRRRKYIRDPQNSSRFTLSHKFDWGNFLTYAKLAAKDIPDNKIKSQISRHWNIFHKCIRRIVRET